MVRDTTCDLVQEMSSLITIVRTKSVIVVFEYVDVTLLLRIKEKKMKKLLLISILLFVSVSIFAQSNLVPPSSIKFISQTSDDGYTFVTVQDLANNEIVILEYGKTKQTPFDISLQLKTYTYDLIKIIRTGMFVKS